MWRNAEVLDFVGWLRAHNDDLSSRRAGRLLWPRPVQPRALDRGGDRVSRRGSTRRPRRARASATRASSRSARAQAYGHAVAPGVSEPCERAVLEQLIELRRGRRLPAPGRDRSRGRAVLRRAERPARGRRREYYRSMFAAPAASWNLRDQHMAETLERLIEHLDRRTVRSRVVVWAHNSHVGDARRTEMSQRGELNLGQLMRRAIRGRCVPGRPHYLHRHGQRGLRAGMRRRSANACARRSPAATSRSSTRPRSRTSCSPSAAERRPLPPWDGRCSSGRSGSSTARRPSASATTSAPISPDQFDAVLHFDRTRAVEPLEPTAGWTSGEPPETYPTAL